MEPQMDRVRLIWEDRPQKRAPQGPYMVKRSIFFCCAYLPPPQYQYFWKIGEANQNYLHFTTFQDILKIDGHC